MRIFDKIYSDFKDIIFWAIIILIAMLVGTGYLMSEVIPKDESIQNLFLVIIGLLALGTISRHKFVLLAVIPVAILWLIFQWWWCMGFIAAILLGSLIKDFEAGKLRYIVIYTFICVAAYPAVIEEQELWLIVLLSSAGVWIGNFLD